MRQGRLVLKGATMAGRASRARQDARLARTARERRGVVISTRVQHGRHVHSVTHLYFGRPLSRAERASLIELDFAPVGGRPYWTGSYSRIPGWVFDLHEATRPSPGKQHAEPPKERAPGLSCAMCGQAIDLAAERDVAHMCGANLTEKPELPAIGKRIIAEADQVRHTSVGMPKEPSGKKKFKLRPRST